MSAPVTDSDGPFKMGQRVWVYNLAGQPIETGEIDGWHAPGDDGEHLYDVSCGPGRRYDRVSECDLHADEGGEAA